MHPDLLRALAEARREDLRHARQGRPIRRRPDNNPRRLARPRRRIGLILIWAGARLMRDQRVALEPAPEPSA